VEIIQVEHLYRHATISSIENAELLFRFLSF
jgi:hypothetical protein